MYHINLIVDPLDKQLMQSRRNAMVGVNPITGKNNTIVTLHLDDEKCGSERLAPYGELHGDDTPGFHRVAPPPTLLSVRLVFMSLSFSIPSFLKMEYGIRLTAVPPSMSILEIGFPLM
jgi:hypothetical protein